MSPRFSKQPVTMSKMTYHFPFGTLEITFRITIHHLCDIFSFFFRDILARIVALFSMCLQLRRSLVCPWGFKQTAMYFCTSGTVHPARNFSRSPVYYRYVPARKTNNSNHYQWLLRIFLFMVPSHAIATTDEHGLSSIVSIGSNSALSHRLNATQWSIAPECARGTPCECTGALALLPQLAARGVWRTSWSQARRPGAYGNFSNAEDFCTASVHVSNTLKYAQICHYNRNEAPVDRVSAFSLQQRTCKFVLDSRLSTPLISTLGHGYFYLYFSCFWYISVSIFLLVTTYYKYFCMISIPLTALCCAHRCYFPNIFLIATTGKSYFYKSFYCTVSIDLTFKAYQTLRSCRRKYFALYYAVTPNCVFTLRFSRAFCLLHDLYWLTAAAHPIFLFLLNIEGLVPRCDLPVAFRLLQRKLRNLITCISDLLELSCLSFRTDNFKGTSRTFKYVRTRNGRPTFMGTIPCNQIRLRQKRTTLGMNMFGCNFKLQSFRLNLFLVICTFLSFCLIIAYTFNGAYNNDLAEAPNTTITSASRVRYNVPYWNNTQTNTDLNDTSSVSDDICIFCWNKCFLSSIVTSFSVLIFSCAWWRSWSKCTNQLMSSFPSLTVFQCATKYSNLLPGPLRHSCHALYHGRTGVARTVTRMRIAQLLSYVSQWIVLFTCQCWFLYFEHKQTGLLYGTAILETYRITVFVSITICYLMFLPGDLVFPFCVYDNCQYWFLYLDHEQTELPNGTVVLETCKSCVSRTLYYQMFFLGF